MTGETKALIGLGVGLFGVGGLLYFGTRPSSASGGKGTLPKLPPGPAPGSSPSTSTSTSTSSGKRWLRASVVQPGDAVRVSVLTADVEQYGAAIQSLLQQGSQDPAVLALFAAYQAMLKDWAPAQPSAQAGAMLLFTVGPYGAALRPAPGGSVLVPSAGDVLPPDWPTDDPNPSGEVHGQFTYAGPSPLPVSSLMIPTLVWTLQ